MLSPKQQDFWKQCNHRWNIKTGATRSGKTYMDYYLIAKRIRATHGKEGIRVLLGNTRSTLERNIIDPMRDIYGDQLIGTLRQNNTIEMFGEKVYALGADKITQVDKLRGAGFIYCYGDEITTWNKEVFEMLKSRLSLPESTFDGTCNPDSPNHWFKSFLDRGELDDDSERPDIYQQNYQIYDNPFLTPKFIHDLEIEYKGTIYYDRFILGKWTLAEGLVYDCYNPETDAIEEVPEELTGRRYVSVDYGTQNPTVFQMWEKGVSGSWYLTDEYYYSGRDSERQKTDYEYVDDFRRFVGNRKIKCVIVDPSAASFIVALKRAGFHVRHAKNDVLDGIRFTASQLNLGKIKILKRCKHTLEEFGAYRWDTKKTDVDAPIKENDHCMDAMRYFVFTILKRKKRRATVRGV